MAQEGKALMQIWVAIELRNEGLERQAHRQVTHAGIAALYCVQRTPITKRGRRGVKVIDHHETWLIPSYMILAHDGEPEFWRRVASVKWQRGGPIMAQPVRIAGNDLVPASAVRDLIARSGDVALPSSVPSLTIGQRARIMADVFAGHEGSVGDLVGSDVLIDTKIGRLRVPQDQVEAA